MKKTLKITLIVIAVIIVSVIGLITYAVVKELQIESKLNDIVLDLANQEVIDMTIETTGDYAKVEKMIKTNYQDFYDLVNKTINEYGNPIISNCLSASNYVKDGPEFINTRKELENLKIKRQELNEQMLAIVSSDEVDNNIKRYKLDDYYGDLYKKYVYGLELIIEDVIKEDKAFNDSIDVVVEILDFLQVEKDHWTVEGEHIIFDDQSLLDKYNWLVDKICIDCNTDESLLNL